MKRILTLFAAIVLALPVFAQEESSFKEDMKYWKSGNYEIRLSKKNYTYAYYHGHNAGIYNTVTGAVVLEPGEKKKEGWFWVPRYDRVDPQAKETAEFASAGIRFLTKEVYHPIFDGMVRIDGACGWLRGIDYPQRAWYCWGVCGIFRIENDTLVPVLRGSKSVDDMYNNGDKKYYYISPVGRFPFIAASYRDAERNKCADIFSPTGEKLYDDVTSYHVVEDCLEITPKDADEPIRFDLEGKLIEE